MIKKLCPYLSKSIGLFPIKEMLPNWKTLLRDPYSIPLSIPVDCELWIRDMIDKHLPDIVNNKSSTLIRN